MQQKRKGRMSWLLGIHGPGHTVFIGGDTQHEHQNVILLLVSNTV